MKKILPTKFEQQNDDLGGLPCLKDEEQGQIVSLWRIPFWQRVRLLIRGKIWLGVLGGSETQPRVWMETY